MVMAMPRQRFVRAAVLGLLALAVLAWLLYSASRPTINIPDVYREYSSDILGIIEPIEVEKCAVWEDGGTVFLKLKDATGASFMACLDGRDWGGPFRDLYLGALHPADDGAYSVGIAGPEEAALYAVLVRYFDANPVDPSNQLTTRSVHYARFAKGLMRKLEERLPLKPP